MLREYQAGIFGLAHYFLRKSSEAQDCTQEAFIKIFRGLAGFQGTADEFVPSGFSN
jgi:DNA-directed RNA polymerase specialized sigma24 family protein